MATRNLSKIIDPNGDEYLIKAKGLENQINISLDGEVTGSATTDLSGNVTISGTAVGNGAVTTDKIADSAVTLEKIADSAKSGSVSDNDGKLATHEQVKSAIDALDSAKTSTDGANVQVKVTEVDGKISDVNITTDNTASASALATEEEARAYADTALDTRLTSAESDIDNLESAVDAMYNSEVAGTTDEINVSSSTSGKVKTFVVSLANVIKTKINAAYDHISDSVKHITDTERTNWNEAYAHSNTEGNPHGTTIEEINGLRSELTEIESDVTAIEELIPSEATPSNQLADKAFVNSSVTSNTATFRGTSAEGLSEAQFLAWANALTKTNNDYIFWNTTDASGNVVFKRYKYDGSNWVYEFSLNNSSFTSVQWAAINSGITEIDVDDIGYNTAARHTHSNKNLLDSYTQSNDSLADAVSKKHSHSNKTVLDNTTASFTTADETKLDGIESGAQVNLPVDTALSDNSTNPVQNKAVKAALDGKAGLADDNKFTGENWFENITRFSTSTGTGHIIRVFPEISQGVYYSYWPEEYKDGNHFREWALRFPSGVNFWGKIRITLGTSFSGRNSSGVMQKSMNVSFNKGTIFNNGGYYNDLGRHTEEEFRISELVWNSSENCWEIRFHSVSPTSNNSLYFVIVEFFTWLPEYANLIDDIYFVGNKAYITTDTSYTASGVGVVSWATKPVFQTPYGNEVFDLSKTLAIANGGTGATTAAGARTNLGLGNVENESVSNGTPDFTEATTRTNIASGEKMSTLFGKIKKWFTDLKTVAFSGSYNDLIDKPTIPSGQVQSDWEQTDTASPDYIKNKPDLDEKAPTNHASTETTYGVGDVTNYGHVKVDSELSSTSTNPVQNKVVKAALDGKAPSVDGGYRTIDQDVSKGANLVVNGNGMLGNNYNFSSAQYEGSESFNGSAGHFKISISTIHANEFIKVDGNNKYVISADCRSDNGASSNIARLSISCYDIDKKEISAYNTMYGAGTTTRLARDLKNGDTKIFLESVSNWSNGIDAAYKRGFIFWNYKNSFGTQYDKEIYSRHYTWDYTRTEWGGGTSANCWFDDASAINVEENSISLKSEWKLGTIPAGTWVSRSSSGNNFKYLSIISNLPKQWTHLSGSVRGFDFSGNNDEHKFYPGTASIKVAWINSGTFSTSNYFRFTNLLFYEIPLEADTLSTPRTIQTNLGSTAPVSFDGSSNVTPGIAGTLPITHGGTGKTNAEDAANALINGLPLWSADVTDSTQIIRQDTNGSAQFGRVPGSAMWNYIKGKVKTWLGIGTDDVLPITHGGTGATTASAARTNLDVYSKGEVNTALDAKQDKLTAGENITIDSDGVISATGGGGAGLFMATYGETSYADVKAAIDAGKIVKCSYVDQDSILVILDLIYYDEEDGWIEFAQTYLGYSESAMVDDGDEWYSYEANAITDESNPQQYLPELMIDTTKTGMAFTTFNITSSNSGGNYSMNFMDGVGSYNRSGISATTLDKIFGTQTYTTDDAFWGPYITEHVLYLNPTTSGSTSVTLFCDVSAMEKNMAFKLHVCNIGNKSVSLTFRHNASTTLGYYRDGKTTGTDANLTISVSSGSSYEMVLYRGEDSSSKASIYLYRK